MSTRNNGKRYNDDFRKMVVDLYHSRSSVKEILEEIKTLNNSKD